MGLASAGLICSIVGIGPVKLFSARKPEVVLRFGTIGATPLFIPVSYLVIVSAGVSAAVWGAVGMESVAVPPSR